ncbi:MAG: hypothetical protein GY854_00675 [Deltaproteobacteria bacterium]|nr:hypothetical protein [Deltaproteobacteria bacterium]
MHFLFWDVEVETLDTARDSDFILARVLERGRLEDVKWAMQTFGLEKIRCFFRDVGHPEVSKKTSAFWRAFFNAKEEKWRTPAHWRTDSSLPWIG